jgi:hypothetical protein
METYGFAAGFTAMAATYVAGMALVTFIRPTPPAVAARSA